jgi:hypothetical protein
VNKVECRDFIFAMEEYLDKNPDEMPEALRKHFSECANCKKIFLEQQAVHKLLQEGKEILQQKEFEEEKEKVIHFSVSSFIIHAAAICLIFYGTYWLAFHKLNKFFSPFSQKHFYVLNVPKKNKTSNFVSPKHINKKEKIVVKAEYKHSAIKSMSEKENKVKVNQIASSKATIQAVNEMNPYYKIVPKNASVCKIKFFTDNFDGIADIIFKRKFNIC